MDSLAQPSCGCLLHIRHVGKLEWNLVQMQNIYEPHDAVLEDGSTGFKTLDCLSIYHKLSQSRKARV